MDDEIETLRQAYEDASHARTMALLMWHQAVLRAHPIKVNMVLEARDGGRALVDHVFVTTYGKVSVRGKLFRKDGSLGVRDANFWHSIWDEPKIIEVG